MAIIRESASYAEAKANFKAKRRKPVSAPVMAPEKT